MKAISSPAVWDYQINQSKLKDPRVKRFYLERKMRYGDWDKISKKDLRTHLDYLKIDPYLHRVLKLILDERIKASPKSSSSRSG